MTSRNLIGVISQLTCDYLAVHPERCLHVRHKNANCLACADACPAGAIAVIDGALTVAPERCVGCGACASVCPTSCLEPLNPADDALAAEVARILAAGDGHVTFACEKAHGGDPSTVSVVCLGRVEESALAEAAARGARDIRLVHGACATCEHARGGALNLGACTSARALFAAVGTDVTVTRMTAEEAWPEAAARADAAPETPAAETPAAAGATEAPAVASKKPVEEPAAFVHVQKDGTLPHFVPTRRLRLYNSLKRLGAPVQDTLATRLWGQVTINTELCRSCRMCTVFCPTGAVSRYGTAAGGFGVDHRSALCVQCRLCETICPEGAITVSCTVSLPEFLSGKSHRFEMEPLDWRPNASDAAATRMARLVKVDRLQDPEARVKPDVLSAMRAHALTRDARRAEIRAEQGE